MPNKKSRAVASGLVFALTGLLTMIAFILSDCNRSFQSCIASGDELFIPAIIGAGLAGMLFFAMFGRVGRNGWLLAAAGAVLTTGVGSIIAVVVLSILEGGNLLSDPLVVVIGPWFIVMMFDQSPVSIPIWIAVMLGAHLILRRGFQANT